MGQKAPPVSDGYPKLFHYTDLKGFCGIWESQTFWATHYNDLNDRSEFARFQLKAFDDAAAEIRKIFEDRMKIDRQFARCVCAAGGVDVIVRKEAKQRLDTFYQMTFGERGLPDTFICSFCAHDPATFEAEHGLLSQWRGYGTGGGVAIVLDTRKLEDLMERERDCFRHPINHMGNVKYDDDDSGIRSEFSEVFRHLPVWLQIWYRGDKEPPHDEEFFDHFVRGTTCVKRRGFHEEREVRIVISLTPKNKASFAYDTSKPGKIVRFRRRGDGEGRYIELFAFGDGTRLPIERIIVGPSARQNLNYQSVCDKIAGSAIKPEKSEIPFRE